MTHRSHPGPPPASPSGLVSRQGVRAAWWRGRRRSALAVPRHRAVPARASRAAHRLSRRHRWPRLLAGALCVAVVLALVLLLATGPAGAATLRENSSTALGMLASKDTPPAEVDLQTVVTRATNWLIGM